MFRCNSLDGGISSDISIGTLASFLADWGWFSADVDEVDNATAYAYADEEEELAVNELAVEELEFSEA